jgi:hypothetical protein
MNFQRILLLLVVLLAAGLAGSFYMNWKTLGQLRTVKAFVEGSVFADAVAACEKAPSTTPFKWTGGKQTAVIGLTSVKLNKDTIFPSYTLVADSVFCDYDPVKKKADIGSNFLERETFYLGRYVAREFANGVGRCRRDHRPVPAQGAELDREPRTQQPV